LAIANLWFREFESVHALKITLRTANGAERNHWPKGNKSYCLVNVNSGVFSSSQLAGTFIFVPFWFICKPLSGRSESVAHLQFFIVIEWSLSFGFPVLGSK
jgi:hypothetical protein